VIDPFNFIDIKQGNQLLTEAINKMLTKVTQWAKQTQSIVLFVAHPAKPANRDNLVATGLDIAGSISWYTKADFLLSVVRNDSDTDVHVQKVRWNFQGSQGVAKLRYDLNSGRFDEISEDIGFDEDYEWTTDF
jgi:RecA-family ATPase